MNTSVYPRRFGSNPLFPQKIDFTIHKTSRSKGLGVLTNKSFKAGDYLAKITGPKVPDILQHTLQISKNLHLHDTYFSGYFLHSCDPNIKVDMQKLEVWAIKPIKKNSYLYMDYTETEDYLFKSFKCNCGSSNCRGIVRGKKDKTLFTNAVLGDNAGILYSEKMWWEREDFTYKNDQLYLAGRLVKELARHADVPTFFYSAARVHDNLLRLKQAFSSLGLSKRTNIFYAMKANRFTPLLTQMKIGGMCGIDACSPQEIVHAVSCGFLPQDISLTATSLSDKDFLILKQYKGIHINCDSITTLKRCIKNGLTNSLGIRINPQTGISRSGNEKLQYTGVNLTKFGIYQAQLNDFLKIARSNGVSINTIHFHTGCGYLNDSLQQLSHVFESVKPFIAAIPEVKTLNLGGGLGVPHNKSDASLDLNAWTKLVKKHFGPSKLNIAIEPGEYIVKDAGILVLEKTYQEKKHNVNFIGLNAGFNIAPEPANYDLPFEPVILEKFHGKFSAYKVVGNINEALDVWFEKLEVEDLSMHKHLALINAGAYSSSMSSNHCMRGEMKEVLLIS
ncbi:MAG: diaminopimelate decarboxylase [Proteobacteria bacterium]|nr:diaminopimelate decarboxylase [Pseudomonadota bacterium]